MFDAPASISGDDRADRRFAKLSPGPGRPAFEVEAHQRARVHDALVQLVSERGLEGVTIRDLASLAGVSSRSFYQRFSDLEDCFLQTNEAIVRRGVRRIVVGQSSGCDWEERLRLGLEAFAATLAADPRAAGFTLFTAYRAGPAALEQMWGIESAFEEMLASSLTRVSSGPVLPRLFVQGIVSGVLRASRSFLTEGCLDDASFGQELLDWVLSFCDPTVDGLALLDRSAASVGVVASPPGPSSKRRTDQARTQEVDRVLILSAVSKLVAAQGYAGLNLRSIRTATGLSRGRFESEFADIDDCFAAAVDSFVANAFAEARLARATASSWGGGIYRLMESLCIGIARDPLLAKACFVDVYAAGESGAGCRERFMRALDEALEEGDPRSLVATRASVGAVWGILRQRIANGQTQTLPCTAASLAFLLLAPSLDAERALLLIAAEQDIAVRRCSNEKLDHQSGGTNDGRWSRRGAAPQSFALQGG